MTAPHIHAGSMAFRASIVCRLYISALLQTFGASFNCRRHKPITTAPPDDITAAKRQPCDAPRHFSANAGHRHQKVSAVDDAASDYSPRIAYRTGRASVAGFALLMGASRVSARVASPA